MCNNSHILCSKRYFPAFNVHSLPMRMLSKCQNNGQRESISLTVTESNFGEVCLTEAAGYGEARGKVE